MANVKKAFQPLIEFLEQNKDKKVSSILAEATELCAAKVGGGGRAASTVIRDDAGNVTHIFCYYHKMWEPVGEGEGMVEYGKKASSPTGYSNMCKEGTAAWTKQQRDSKSEKDALLAKVATGEIEPSAIKAEMDKIEKRRAKIHPRADGIGISEEDMVKASAEKAA